MSKVKPTENFDVTFWEYNYPVQLSRDEETGEVSYVIYQPRKNRCWNSLEDSENVPKDELKAFIDNSIAKFRTAIILFEQFKKGDIDHIGYWDELEATHDK